MRELQGRLPAHAYDGTARATIGSSELKFGEEARRRRADRGDGTMGRIDGPRGEAEGASAHPRHFGPPHCCCYYCCCEG